MSAATTAFEDFLAFSAYVTGFTTVRLHGTGHADVYWTTVCDIVGTPTLVALGAAFREAERASGGDAELLAARLRADILSDPQLGPVARNIIKLWYSGAWYALPFAWREAYGARDRDTTFVVAPTAYAEGLLWPAIGANPSGAKGPGYGTWSGPPRIDD